MTSLVVRHGVDAIISFIPCLAQEIILNLFVPMQGGRMEIIMRLVMLTALGVGGATMLGALLGFLIKKISHKVNDVILGFAAGVMLCAAVFGLIMPSLSAGRVIDGIVTAAGIFAGALFLSGIDRFVPHLHSMAGVQESENKKNEQLSRVMMFVFAIAIHNLPEGVAAGVSFGTGDTAAALTVAGGIALQNIPEGMIIIAPMIAAGISKKRTLIIALFTGFIEVVGTFIGYFAAGVSAALLPFALAFAGGTMLYVISDEMIPETHSHGYEKLSTYALLFGFCIMMIMDLWIG